MSTPSKPSVSGFGCTFTFLGVILLSRKSDIHIINVTLKVCYRSVVPKAHIRGLGHVAASPGSAGGRPPLLPVTGLTWGHALIAQRTRWCDETRAGREGSLEDAD